MNTPTIAMGALVLMVVLALVHVTSPLSVAPASTLPRNRLAWVLALLLALLAVAGCNYRTDIKAVGPLGVVAYTVHGQFTAYEFRLQDGTRCVTVTSNSITCDWDSPRPSPAGGVEVSP